MSDTIAEGLEARSITPPEAAAPAEIDAIPENA